MSMAAILFHNKKMVTRLSTSTRVVTSPANAFENLERPSDKRPEGGLVRLRRSDRGVPQMPKSLAQARSSEVLGEEGRTATALLSPNGRS